MTTTWNGQDSGTLRVSWDRPWRRPTWWKSQFCC